MKHLSALLLAAAMAFAACAALADAETVYDYGDLVSWSTNGVWHRSYFINDTNIKKGYIYFKDATCTTPGTIEVRCSQTHNSGSFQPQGGYPCYQWLTVHVNPLRSSHELKAVSSSTPATCMSNATQTGTCVYCRKEVTIELPNTMLKHNFETYTPVSDATCSAAATEISYCTYDCGTSDTRSVAGSAVNPDQHSWGKWESTGNDTHTRTCAYNAAHTQTYSCSGGKATCTQRAVCDECGEEYGEVDDQQHTVIPLPAVEPTATRDGLTEGRYCTECKRTLVAQEIVPALGIPASGNPAALPATGDSASLAACVLWAVSGAAGAMLMRRRKNR